MTATIHSEVAIPGRVLEAAGPNGLRLLAALHQAARPVCVVNPLQVRRFAQRQLRRSKTDRTHSGSASLDGFSPRPCIRPRPVAEPVAAASGLACLNLLKGQRTARSNHQHALALAAWPDPVSTQALEAELARLDQEVADLEKRLEQDAKAECGTDDARLQTIPGGGPRVALTLLLAGPGLLAFAGWRQAVAYAGLCPRYHESGRSVRSWPKLSKLGDGRLCNLLSLGPWPASRANPACRAIAARFEQTALAYLALVTLVAIRMGL